MQTNRFPTPWRGLALAVLALAFAAPAHAQFVRMKPGAKAPTWASLPDWSGVWERDGHIGWDPALPFDQPLSAPYNTEYQAKAAEARKNRSLADAGAACEGGGMPGMMTAVFPMELELNPRQVTLIGEGQSSPRRIFTDGRDHPAEPFPSTVGHSIGEWRKGELFVDTCCLKPTNRIPGGGVHSDALSLKEHFWSPEPGTLKVEVTILDPKALTRPWTVVKTFRRRPDWEPVEYLCNENNRNPLGADGVAQVLLSGDDGFTPPPSFGASTPVAAGAPAVKRLTPPGAPFGKEQMQRATAVSLGNMAWEGVGVEDGRKDGSSWKWTASTPTGKWRCTAQADGKNPYCER